MAQKYNWDQLYKDYLKSGLTKSQFASRCGAHPSSVRKAFNEIEAMKSTPVNPSAGSIPKDIPKDPPVFSPVVVIPSEEPTGSPDTPAQPEAFEKPLVISFKDISISISDSRQIGFLEDILRSVVTIC